MIRTSTDVPEGMAIVAAAIAIDSAPIAKNKTARIRMKYRVIACPNFPKRSWTLINLLCYARTSCLDTYLKTMTITLATRIGLIVQCSVA